MNELMIPNGTFNITAPAEVDVEFVTGKKIFGQSRAGSIIRQLTDDVPIHRFCIRLMHSCEFRDLTYSYANMQTGKTGARVFDFVDYNDLGPACLVYNCQWRNIFGLKWYWFRSEERRVGKTYVSTCRLRGWMDHKKKKKKIKENK